MDILISANDNFQKIIKNIKNADNLCKDESGFYEEMEKIINSQAEKQSTDKTAYKCSRYNYVKEKPDQVLIYNTLYNALVRLSRTEYEIYLRQGKISSEITKAFADNGLWVDADTDEYESYIKFGQAYTLFHKRAMELTITTTTKCNAKCVYCYEQGICQKDIFSCAGERIMDFIREKATTKEVDIVWFGGEPLMNTQCIDDLTDRLTAEGFAFTSSIITNGSLLTEQIIKNKCRKWKVDRIQVTLDGTSKIYEQRKQYVSREYNFYRVMHNLILAAEEEVFITIRLNIDKKNQKDMLSLVKELESVFEKNNNVVFYPAFITGTKDSLKEEEKAAYVKKMLLSVNSIKKLTTATKLYTIPRMCACMHGDPYSYVIDVDANVYTCEHYVGKKEHAVGNVDGLFGEDERGKNLKIRQECCDCVFLPKCFGGCDANFKNGDDPCSIEKYMIQAYLEIL